MRIFVAGVNDTQVTHVAKAILYSYLFPRIVAFARGKFLVRSRDRNVQLRAEGAFRKRNSQFFPDIGKERGLIRSMGASPISRDNAQCEVSFYSIQSNRICRRSSVIRSASILRLHTSPPMFRALSRYYCFLPFTRGFVKWGGCDVDRTSQLYR